MEEHILRHTLALSLTLFIVIFFVAFQKQVINTRSKTVSFVLKNTQYHLESLASFTYTQFMTRFKLLQKKTEQRKKLVYISKVLAKRKQ